MLQIKNIKKEYKTGTLIQQALNDVSLNLRDNEFVAILGPSGSGKSTLLNIIGGLDRYDSGNLIINGVSTRKYKDRDWDSYRNHTIGFIFQSYNLIPHQTVLSNVELALTISGISGAERKQRAEEALIQVGLGDQMHKKPNQMSGGQMQRVAIARALVNNPSILLADEPTGALDTETSVQVMNLLKEVAKDRLVVMVTHNPDLAKEYATRIVRLKDGKIIADTNPYVINEEEIEAPVHKNLGKASMSFLTALSLSKNNLLTKKARTLLVSFAGSIGIIGIALIMSLSNGVNVYINDTERETLSEYPLTISSTSFDLTSLMASNMKKKTEDQTPSNGVVKENDVVANMFEKAKSNDLSSLKEYLDTDPENLSSYSDTVEYSYDVDPLIYRQAEDKDYKVNPNTTLTSSGLMPTSSIYSSTMKTNIFSQLPQDTSLYEDQYNVKAGRWPENDHEAVVISDSTGSVSDMTLYTLGLKDYANLQQIIDNANTGKSVEDTSESRDYAYDEFLGITFKLVNSGDLYTYDETNQLWTDRSSDTEYVKNVVASSEDIKIVGVVMPVEGTQVSMLTTGIGYPYALTARVMEQAKNSAVVKAQLANKDVNIFTGNTFDADNTSSGFDPSKLFSIDSSKMSSAFTFDESKINTNISDFMDPSALTSASSGTNDSFSQAMQSIAAQFSPQNLSPAFTKVLNAYLTYAEGSPSTDYANLNTSLISYLNTEDARKIMNADLKVLLTSSANLSTITASYNSLLTQIMAGLPQYLAANNIKDVTSDVVNQYLASSDVQGKIMAGMPQLFSNVEISTTDQQKLVNDLVTGYTVYAQANGTPDPTKMTDSFNTWLATPQGQAVLNASIYSAVDMQSLGNSIEASSQAQSAAYSAAINTMVQNAMTQMMSQIPNAISIDPDVMSSAFTMNMDSTELQSMFQSMLSQGTITYDGNLSKLGYADETKPSQISIYPKNFEAKDSIKNILDSYNKQMNDQGQEEKVISYTDMVGTLMSSVTNIVNTISYVLIAFVAISLVVSSIMIGVITYISVLERKKEIGILRAIGASKHNISSVFNAETFITGLLAGVIGIVIAGLLLLPTNYIIHMVTGNNSINAVMPMGGAVFLILLSIFLTLLGGLIPSKKAAKSDPVAALRTE